MSCFSHLLTKVENAVKVEPVGEFELKGDQATPAVKVEPVGEFELKGIRRPLAAYNVVGA
jgi:hypothetical protein